MNQELLYASVVADQRTRSLHAQRELHSREAARLHVARKRARRASARRLWLARVNTGTPLAGSGTPREAA